MHILVIDSDPIQVQSLSRGLKGRGYSISTATSKAEAYAALDLSGADIGLILIDIKVPRLDPFELLRQSKESQNSYPIIIMTTYIDKELQEKMDQETGIALIEKPFVLEKLLQEIEKINSTQNISVGHYR